MKPDRFPNQEILIMNLEILANYLEILAIKRATCSYVWCAHDCGMDVPKPATWKSSVFGILIAAITDEDARLNRPLRSSVLVRAKEQTPGRGYFTLFNRVRAANLSTHEERMDAWTKERWRAAMYPWPAVSGLNVKRFHLPAVAQVNRMSGVAVGRQ